MSRARWITLSLALLSLVVIAAVAGARLAGGEREALGEDPDFELERAGSSHVGSPAGYAKTNQVQAPLAAPTAGWAGEVQLANEDTWEPDIAADPSAPYVYAFYTRYAPSCGQGCPSPAVMLRISSDGGTTWGAEKLMPSPKVQGQYDPVITTTATGAVYATWMNYNTIVFSKSADHGQTWSAPVSVSGNSWADKPWLGTSDDGNDVYIAYASRSQLFLTSSHNAGATWSAPIAVNKDKSVYRYPNGFSVLPNGTAVLSVSKYPGGSRQATGAVEIEVWRSANGGDELVEGPRRRHALHRLRLQHLVDDDAGQRRVDHGDRVLRCYLPWRQRSSVRPALDRRWAHVVGTHRTGRPGGERQLPGDRGTGDRRREAELDGRPWRSLERLDAAELRRRADVGGSGRHLRRDRGSAVQVGGGVRLGVRRLRRDRDHERRQDRVDRRRGGVLLAGPRQHLVQPADVRPRGGAHVRPSPSLDVSRRYALGRADHGVAGWNGVRPAVLRLPARRGARGRARSR